MSHINATLLGDYIVTALDGGTVDGEVFPAPSGPAPYSYPKPHRRITDGIARYLNKYDEPGTAVTLNTWTPTLYVGGVAHGGGYSERQGYFLQAGDLILALAWVRTSGSISPSGNSLAIGDLPSAGSMLTTLEFWPCWTAQASLLGGAVYPRLRPSNSTRVIINDSGTQLGLTSWTFTEQFFVCVGAVYRVSS